MCTFAECSHFGGPKKWIHETNGSVYSTSWRFPVAFHDPRCPQQRDVCHLRVRSEMSPGNWRLVGGWTNPIWKICSSKWVHLPQVVGVKSNPKIFELPPLPSYFLGPSNDHPWPTITHDHSMVNWWFWLLGLKSLHAKTRNHQDHLVFRIPPEPLAVQQPRKIHKQAGFRVKKWIFHTRGALTPIVHVDGTFYPIIYSGEEFITIVCLYPHPLFENAPVILHWRLGFTLPLSLFASNMNLKARHGFFPGVILHQKDLRG